MDETSLNPSVLGTLEYWDEAYRNELENFADHGDVGEVWFGESVSKKIVKWIVENRDVNKNDNILDIGCGNGVLLIELGKRGYTSLHGVDYSKNAIDLALGISAKENVPIDFRVGNILDDVVPSARYALALDKGTFDAISLDPSHSKRKRERYVANVHKILTENGTLLLTSCNWTEDELKKHFAPGFNHVETLPTPSISFGGKKGNTVTSVVFKKR